MQNALKGAILQAMTENSNANAVTLQALQHTTVVAAVDQPIAVQNGQNNDITTVHNILYNSKRVQIVQNSNCLYPSSNIGVFSIAGLVLLHHTSSTTENSSIDK